MSNGRIPESIIEAVLKQHDIVDVVGRYVHLSKQGHYMKGLCPFHSEKTPSFTVTADKQIYHCFGCNAGGNAIHFIMNIEGLSYPEAISLLAEQANIETSWEPKTPEQTEQQKDVEMLLQAYDFTAKTYHYILMNTEQGKAALAYLRSRGISDKLIEQFQIGYAPPMWDKLKQFLDNRKFALPLMEKGGLLSAKSSGDDYVDKFRDRIIFPIHSAKGSVIAFAGRAMGDVQPKYMNSPESMLFTKSKTLYHFQESRTFIRKQRQAVLFEGYVDLMKAWEAGILNGVATMGTALTEEHARILRQNAEQVIVCYDGDDAGLAAANKSIPILERAGLHVKVAVIPNGLDPDEYISSNGAERFIRDIIEGAMPVVGFKLTYIRRNFNLQDIDARLRYINSAVKLISELPSPVDREHYMKEISTEFSISPDAVRQQTNEMRQQYLKKQQIGDNNTHSWNNGWNDEPRTEKLHVKYTAYEQAERDLLVAMMADAEVARYVQQQVGDQFQIEEHAALAAYLYSYYSQSNPSDIVRFLNFLQDDGLERIATSIFMTDTYKLQNEQAINDCIRVVLKYDQNQQIARMKNQMKEAERAGDHLMAAKIAQEIISLEKQLKSSIS